MVGFRVLFFCYALSAAMSAVGVAILDVAIIIASMRIVAAVIMIILFDFIGILSESLIVLPNISTIDKKILLIGIME